MSLKLQDQKPKFQPFLYQAPAAKAAYQNITQLTLKISVLCITTFYFGYTLTYISTFRLQQLEYIGLKGGQPANTPMHSALIGVNPLGALIGSAVARLIMKKFTRKQFVLLINLCAIIIEGIMEYPNLWVFLVGRIFQGLFTGMYMAITPVYIKELCPKAVVGNFGVFTQLFVAVGLVVAYGIGLGLQVSSTGPDTFYHVMITVIGVIQVLQSILFLANFVPESPNSLLAMGKIQEAKEVIGMFNAPQFVEAVFKEKQFQVNAQKGLVQKVSVNFPRKAYFLGFQISFMQQATGAAAIIVSAGVISQKVVPSIVLYVPLIINSAQLVADIIAVFIVTKIGRKPLILFGNLTLGVVDLTIGILFLVSNEWGGAGMFIFVLLIVYMFVYGLSLGPVVRFYVPEIVPANAVPIATVMNWLSCSVCVIVTPIVNKSYGNSAPMFLAFGSISIVLFIVNAIMMVETKGKTASQVAEELSKKK